jgi:hypothetical protein
LTPPGLSWHACIVANTPDWESEDPWDAYEVQRFEDQVTLVFTRINGDIQGFNMTPEDATSIGVALVQAGQEPEESM